MSEKIRRSVLLRPDEDAKLEQLAAVSDRSCSAVVRLLIRQAQAQSPNLLQDPVKEGQREQAA